MADLIEVRLQEEATRRPAEYKACRTIEVRLEGRLPEGPELETANPELSVEFSA